MMDATEFLLMRYRAELANVLRAVGCLQENGKREVSNTCRVWIVAGRDMDALSQAVTEATMLLMEEDPARTLGEEWVSYAGR